VVAKGEFAAGFAVPSYMAFEDRLAGFDIKFVAPKTAWITPEPIAIPAGAKHPKAARAFIEFMLSERGQRVAMERGVFPITPKYRVQGAPGSTAEAAVEFTGGMRSYFDREVTNIYVDAVRKRATSRSIRSSARTSSRSGTTSREKAEPVRAVAELAPCASASSTSPSALARWLR
jgi:ABC-type Fe3+ transport system substrate-binding protein